MTDGHKTINQKWKRKRVTKEGSRKINFGKKTHKDFRAILLSSKILKVLYENRKIILV